MSYVYVRMKQDSEREKLKEISDSEPNGTVGCRYKRKKDMKKKKLNQFKQFERKKEWPLVFGRSLVFP